MNTTANGYKNNVRCKICSGVLRDGTKLRISVETMKGEGRSNKEIIQLAWNNGIEISSQNIVRHLRYHAKYVTRGTLVPEESRKAVTTLTHSSESAKNLIKKILGRGEEMIDNWWQEQTTGEKVNGPQMPITPKMILGAMDQEIKRAPKTALDTDIESLTQQAIEGEVVENEPEQLS